MRVLISFTESAPVYLCTHVCLCNPVFLFTPVCPVTYPEVKSGFRVGHRYASTCQAGACLGGENLSTQPWMQLLQ